MFCQSEHCNTPVLLLGTFTTSQLQVMLRQVKKKETLTKKQQRKRPSSLSGRAGTSSHQLCTWRILLLIIFCYSVFMYKCFTCMAEVIGVICLRFRRYQESPSFIYYVWERIYMSRTDSFMHTSVQCGSVWHSYRLTSIWKVVILFIDDTTAAGSSCL